MHPAFSSNPRHARVDYPVSWQAYALNWAMSLSIRPLLEVTAATVGSPQSRYVLALARQAYALGGMYARSLPDYVQVEKVDFGAFDGEWLRAGSGLQDSKVMLYLHGGGYFFSSAEHHRPITWRLSRAANRPVLAINYRMAPEHDFEHWREDAITAYQHLLLRGYKPENILIGGDSAGGHLTLVTLQTLRDRGLPLPRAALCISPWTDLANTAGSHASNRWRDPMFAATAVRALADLYVQGRDPYDPLVSPLYGSFEGLPPLMIMAGSTEVLRDDARRAADKARASGVPVIYEEWHRMPHVFPIFAFILPEGRRAYRHMARFFQMVEKGAAPHH